MKAFKPSIVNIAGICAQKQVRNFVISSGSRSAPLTLAFLRHPQIQCLPVVDERSAAFTALGMAQQTQKPVGLVCTSGTAGLNYAPAVAEAFYQQIPLLIFTADRPPEWIDQNDGQTLHQRELFGKHCRASFELPVDPSHPDARWQVERTISEAINSTTWPVPGPVHINVPLREPLYPTSDFGYSQDYKLVGVTQSQAVLDEPTWQVLLQIWTRSPKKLIVAGLQPPDPVLAQSLQKLQQDPTAAIIFDVTANLQDALFIQHSDIILGTGDESGLQQLAPDLLITLGGPVVSKNLKSFLRKYRPKVHWQIQTSVQSIDTFQSLTQIVPVSASYFFETPTRLLARENSAGRGGTRDSKDSYQTFWHRRELKARKALEVFLKEMPHCEFSAMACVLQALPRNSHLQLGNSFIVRMANFLGLPPAGKIKVNSNRGTCGIDGTVSTAVGAARATSRVTTLLVGDLAFFYDRNALWQGELPANLRIVVINNQGGGIFRILDGAGELPELERYFAMEHRLTAENTARDHGLNYTRCEDAGSLEKSLPQFFAPQEKPALLEIHTDKRVNEETFRKFKSLMREM
ncbi:MAG: 2-succinyl-5-enolpyruvyl-6-hydroxy-3-cyclohexene-1-carboxylic-acid synthase [bacterium]